MVIKYDEKQFRKVCLESKTMSEAAAKLGLHFNTFKRIAVKLGVYNPNQGSKGLRKPKAPYIPMTEILEGKHPQFQTYKLKKRLLKDGIKSNVCEVCGIDSWAGMSINMELDHIDGVRTNHKLDNLRMICPNCHSQTDTYRARNKSLNREID
jgi:hypothetical protein